MKIKCYCLVVLMGLFWPITAVAGIVNVNVPEVDELGENIHGIGPILTYGIVNYR